MAEAEKTLDKLEIGATLVVTDEDNKEHEFECVGEITLTFEGEDKPRTYFINADTATLEKDSIDYLVTDENGNVEEEESLADAVMDTFLESVQNEKDSTSESETQEKK